MTDVKYRFPIVNLDIGYVCNLCGREWNHECFCTKTIKEKAPIDEDRLDHEKLTPKEATEVKDIKDAPRNGTKIFAYIETEIWEGWDSIYYRENFDNRWVNTYGNHFADKEILGWIPQPPKPQKKNTAAKMMTGDASLACQIAV